MLKKMIDKTNNIVSWKQFSKRVRSSNCSLLKRLDEFRNSVIVTGCQRSGTTMLSRVITRSEGMTNYWFGRDDELDAALILSGKVSHQPIGRYCFQTTYLNDRYYEYYDKKEGHKIIWVLRNPLSVVYSMIYNWKNFALDELFDACGSHLLSERDRILYKLFGKLGVSRLKRACFAFNGKISQLFDIKQRQIPCAIKAVEYDELVLKKHEILPLIYKFIDLPYKTEYADMINTKSLSKVSKISRKERRLIEEICLPVYHNAARLIDIAA